MPPMVPNNWPVTWRKGQRAEFMLCVFYDRNIHRKRTGGFSTLMRIMHSMRRTGQK